MCLTWFWHLNVCLLSVGPTQQLRLIILTLLGGTPKVLLITKIICWLFVGYDLCMGSLLLTLVLIDMSVTFCVSKLSGSNLDVDPRVVPCVVCRPPV